MGLFITNEVKSLYVGDKAVVEVYLGNEKIWENANLICTYDIDEPGETLICSNINNVLSIIVDGVSMDPVGTYNFEEAGEHTVEFVLIDKNLIGERMFISTGIKSVVIPNSVISINDHEFYGCTALSEITIGNNVTSIGSYAFYYCAKLSSITIPDNVTSIGDYAFYGCSSLSEITCLTTKLEVVGDAFRNLPSSGVLKVPAGSNTGLENHLPEGWTVEYI